MRAKRFPWLILPIAIACSFWATGSLYSLHKTNRHQYISGLIYLPKAILQAASLEFSGVLSDYLMLQTLVFHGEKILQKNQLTPEEWQATYLALQQITNLDPRFWDPYVLAETSLPWDAGMVEETNELLLKAAKVRTTDHRPYFFLWFNHYYFLKDMGNAAKYLEKASRIPGAPEHYATLAARGSLAADRTESGILFLKEILQETTDPARQEWIKLRLQALMAIALLEKNIDVFHERFGRKPNNLQELIYKQLINRIPPDPYGGTFYITKNGRVYTTSKLVPMKKKEKIDNPSSVDTGQNE